MTTDVIAHAADAGVRVLAEGLAFPEGPAFAPDGALWCVELRGGALVRLAAPGARAPGGVAVHDGPAGDVAVERFAVGGAPNGAAVDARGRVWFCDADAGAIRRLDPATGHSTTLITAVEGRPLDRPNDLAFDAAGNLVFTCPGDSRREPTGSVCVARPSGEVRTVARDLFFPNGLAFGPDGRTLVVAETYRHRLWRGRWDAERAAWDRAAPWADVGGPNGPGGPDGLAFDGAGRLYAAVYGVGLVRVVAPDGSLHASLAISGQNPTNCAFRPGTAALVVTEAERGRLLALDVVGAAGLPLGDGAAAAGTTYHHEHATPLPLTDVP